MTSPTKHKPMFLATQNDGLSIIDRKPHPAPNDHPTSNTMKGTNVIAKLTGTDQAAIDLGHKMAASEEMFDALECVRFNIDAEYKRSGCLVAKEELATIDAVLAKARGRAQ